MNFRKDINGLRAIAVMAVVGFHFGITQLSGGFVGVDIFFVISGFLITGIIVRKVEDNRFSIWNFYLDRARRIIPALAVLCLALLGAGWFLLTPASYETVGKHIASSMIFISNVVYWRESGYFDLASHEKWLLHTWSLSVEWQFYIIYPLVILLLAKFLTISRIRWALVAATVISLALSIYASTRWPGAAFYLLPTRAWEMLAGALIHLFPTTLKDSQKRLVEITGLVMIAFSVLHATSTDIWPGWRALIPVLGTALVIIAARNESLYTGNRVSQFLGKTSYSIYLWHWPIVVALYSLGLSDKPIWRAIGIGSSMIMGYLSFTFVEGYVKSGKKRTSSWRAYAPVAAVFSFICVVGTAISLQGGVSSRMTKQFNALTKDIVMPLIDNGWCFYSVDTDSTLPVGSRGLNCPLGSKTSHVKGLLFGDSFAGHNGPFWDAVAVKSDWQINSVATNWCYPAINEEFAGPRTSRAFDQCQINKQFLKENMGNYDFVVFASQWENEFLQGKMQSVYDEIAYAADHSKLVVLMAAPTRYDVNIKSRYEQSLMSGTSFDIENFKKSDDAIARRANAEVERFGKKFPNVFFINRGSLYNTAGVPSDMTNDGRPYSLDGAHLSVYGSLQSAEAFVRSSSYAELKRRVAAAARLMN